MSEAEQNEVRPLAALLPALSRSSLTLSLSTLQYKYILDVDGNGWSGRFHRLMSTNSLILKSTAFPEWYSDRIQPWVHYVPVKVDYSDLYPVLAFFKGAPEDGRGGHDELAERIAAQGKQWADENWRWVDMQAYLLRLLLEYARLVNRDDPHVSYDYELE
ncbi:glycosyltransferase family 90 protein [Rhodotorula graminis WP1]|uniref:Glycosyltransferase family 90 protein n=1 Tax=Rhodotorula graminis (strain WP1) TaxID=578459 RepID=A0A194S3Q2_RHOGW|nr:glycosyltransferase family 90 protein [Rhodotorula graminis WP1]KPV75135.1 glycosyltransferase family 90 protein [Rhodotorula graminis WP1]